MTLLAAGIRVPERGLDMAKLPAELLRMFGESYELMLSFAIAAMVLGIEANSQLRSDTSCQATRQLVSVNILQNNRRW
jgi:hypothetical protein